MRGHGVRIMPRVPNRRPQLRIVAPAASPEEAAAVVAALERFMRETAPTPAPDAAARERLAAGGAPGGRRARARPRALALAGPGEALRHHRDAVGARPPAARRAPWPSRAAAGVRPPALDAGMACTVNAARCPRPQARDVAAHAPAVAERPRRRGHEQARGRAVAEAHGQRRRRCPCPARRRGRRRARRRAATAGAWTPTAMFAGRLTTRPLTAMLLVVLGSGVSEVATTTLLKIPATSMRARTRITTSRADRKRGAAAAHRPRARAAGGSRGCSAVTPRICATWLGRSRVDLRDLAHDGASTAGSGPLLRTRMVTVTTSPTVAHARRHASR